MQSDNSNIQLHQLEPFDDERAFQYLDHMLVAKDRTLNLLQKDLVSEVIATNNNPVFIRMLMSEIEKWKSTDNVVAVPFVSFKKLFTRLFTLPNTIHQSGVCLLSLKMCLGPSLSCQFWEYAGNWRNLIGCLRRLKLRTLTSHENQNH